MLGNNRAAKYFDPVHLKSIRPPTDKENLFNELTRQLSIYTLKSTRTPFDEAFKQASRSIQALGPEERRFLFTCLIEQLFDIADLVNEGKSEYIRTCRKALELPSFSSDKLSDAAEMALRRIKKIGAELLSDEIAAFLQPRFMESSDWGRKRVEYICQVLESNPATSALREVLNSKSGVGLTTHLLRDYSDLSKLQKSYARYLKNHFNNRNSKHDAYGICVDLAVLESSEVFDSHQFRKMRDQCLKDKFIRKQINDLPEFLAYYQRDDKSPGEFAPHEKIALNSMQTIAKDAVLLVISNSYSGSYRAAKVAMNAILPSEFSRSSEFYNAAFIGAVKNFQAFRDREKAFSFVNSLPDQAYDEIMRRILYVMPEMAPNNGHRLITESGKLDKGLPCYQSVSRQKALASDLLRAGRMGEANIVATRTLEVLENCGSNINFISKSILALRPVCDACDLDRMWTDPAKLK
jgi:hypothetical protein